MTYTFLAKTFCPDAAALVEYRDIVREIAIMTNVEHYVDVVKYDDGTYVATVTADLTKVDEHQYTVDLAAAVLAIELRAIDEQHNFTEIATIV